LGGVEWEVFVTNHPNKADKNIKNGVMGNKIKNAKINFQVRRFFHLKVSLLNLSLYFKRRKKVVINDIQVIKR
jgi:hypothetical protein